MQLFMTKKALSALAILVAVVAWFINHATKIELPFGIAKNDALTGLGSVGAFLGILGASPLPGGTLLKGKGDAGGGGASVLLPFVGVLGLMARPLFLLLVVLGLMVGPGVVAAPAFGCATVKPVTNAAVDLMPTVHTYVQDGQLVVSTVEGIERTYFAGHPNPDLQKKVEILIANAKTALDAGLRICAATEHLSNSQIIDAFADFRRLYTDVVALLGPYGARHDGRAGAGAGAGAPGPDLALPDPPLLMGVKRS